ncbi:hypothetical protein ISN45_Aa05g012140 [Arabidopsis thaliana x Arabidopsis arenosa]|uniref:Uncharacterized protein n=1 Tax=Arabidopsis thaliana x Arabidopsis arenosa TaxID=1240361 RepID=A0A8T1ZLP2_9BRAS|nr:hypothetical protein ISN45_Aa05g012140 [Arabidopsis thaliana x Arabidopsis arenosa]
MSSSKFAIFCIILFSLASLYECTNVEGFEASKINLSKCLPGRCEGRKKCFCCRYVRPRFCAPTKEACETAPVCP